MAYGAPRQVNPLDNSNATFFGGGGGGGGRSGAGGSWGSYSGNRPTGVAFPPGQGPNGPTTPGAPIQPNSPNEGSNNTTPGGSPGGADPNNFGQPMHPWDMPYGGQFTAPMSGTEQQALGGFSNFMQNGMGLNQSGNYLNDVLSGKYLDLNSNPYLQQIQQGEQGIKDYNDKQAMDRIGSGMALGGNALSGARLGAGADYMRNSNNAFESMMGQLMNQNYGMERGAMNNAPGQAANLANTAQSGYGQLFGMGATPRNIQQHDYDSQYNDFLRQTGAMNHDSERPDNQLMQFLSNAGYKGQYNPTYGSSLMDQLAAAAGQGGWGDIISQFFGGAANGLGGNDQQNQNQNGSVQFDGRVIGHDGPTAPAATGPANYYDRDWYQGALRDAKIKQAAAQQKQNPNSNAAAIATLLMSILGQSGGGKKKSGSVGMGGGGGSLANSAGKAAGSGIKSLWDSIFGPKPGQQPYAATQPGGMQGPENPYGDDLNLPPGGGPSSMDENGVSSSQIDWSNYGYPGDVGGSNTDLSNFLDQYPASGFDSGGGGFDEGVQF